MRSTPARRMAASNTSSAPTSAPVWKAESAGRGAWRPAFITTTGLTRAAARSALMNRRASLDALEVQHDAVGAGSRAR